MEQVEPMDGIRVMYLFHSVDKIMEVSRVEFLIMDLPLEEPIIMEVQVTPKERPEEQHGMDTSKIEQETPIVVVTV